jgi:malonyl-CoA/methylmalonyl-CoA synthetase
MSNHLFDVIRRSIPASDAVFIETTERHFTYGDMVKCSGRLAAAMTAAGVYPGDRVAVQVEKSAEALMLYLACRRNLSTFEPCLYAD